MTNLPQKFSRQLLQSAILLSVVSATMLHAQGPHRLINSPISPTHAVPASVPADTYSTSAPSIVSAPSVVFETPALLLSTSAAPPDSTSGFFPIPAAAQAKPSAPPVAPTPKRGFFTRLGHAYLDDWTVDPNGLPTADAPQRRGYPAPLNSPPFPSADWPIGGTVVIGAPDYQT